MVRGFEGEGWPVSLLIKEELYRVGVEYARLFLDVNDIKHPTFVTFEETEKYPKLAVVLSLAKQNPLVGGLTAFYRLGCVCVNVPVTALPVKHPQYRSWSYPGWKTDRTAVGVVAHEVGHYVEEHLRFAGKLDYAGNAWREIIRGKKVSGYEPKPSEAWAESMRLFILNPKLLRAAIPRRYEFISQLLRPSETRSWKRVLDNPDYVQAGERWINV